MKSVRMTNNTSKTLTAYNIPLQENGSIKVEPGDSAIIGIYSITYSRDYAAMVKSGFTMDFVDDSTNNVAVSQSADTIVEDKKVTIPQIESKKNDNTVETVSTTNADTQDDTKEDIQPVEDDSKEASRKRSRRSSKTNEQASPDSEKASENND